MNLKEQSKYFFVACFIGMILLAFLIVKPFLVAVLASIILTYVFYPIYRRVNKVIKNKNLCLTLQKILVIRLRRIKSESFFSSLMTFRSEHYQV